MTSECEVLTDFFKLYNNFICLWNARNEAIVIHLEQFKCIEKDVTIKTVKS